MNGGLLQKATEEVAGDGEIARKAELKGLNTFSPPAPTLESKISI